MAEQSIASLLQHYFTHDNPTLNLLLLMVIIWTTGVICRRIKQPPVLGELLAGVIFGPTLLGIIKPDETLAVLSEYGVFFLMFYAGLETNAFHLRRYNRQSLLVGFFGYIIPFGLTVLVCLFFGLPANHTLFIAMALSITAIAVSTRVLHDLQLTGYRIAPIIIGATIIDDVISLSLFSMLVELASGQAGFNVFEVIHSLLKVAVFFAVSIVIGLRLFPRLRQYFASREAKGFTFSLIAALFFGFFAEISGLHIIIGAYMAGLFVRQSIQDQALFTKITDRFVSITYGFLGPIFFFCLSFHVTFTILHSHPVLAAALLLTAIIGKIVGPGLGALLGKMTKEEAIMIGLTMNGRGAVELIIASVGLEMGIIDDNIFSLLVFIAFITTLLPPVTLKPVFRKVGGKLSPAS